jgi:hypothetical protein
MLLLIEPIFWLKAIRRKLKIVPILIVRFYYPTFANFFEVKR